MGSWMAASFRPSIGPSSLPVMAPSYSKVQWDGLALGEGRGWGDADGAVGGALAGEELAGLVGDFGDLERGMKAEVDHLERFTAR